MNSNSSKHALYNSLDSEDNKIAELCGCEVQLKLCRSVAHIINMALILNVKKKIVLSFRAVIKIYRINH